MSAKENLIRFVEDNPHLDDHALLEPVNRTIHDELSITMGDLRELAKGFVPQPTGIYVVQCALTGVYVVDSGSRKCNPFDLAWAKRYKTFGGADSARGSHQKSADFWYDGTYLKNGKPVPHMHHPCTPDPNEKRQFKVIELME